MTLNIHQEAVARAVLGPEAMMVATGSTSIEAQRQAQEIHEARVAAGTDTGLEVAGETYDRLKAAQAIEKQFGTRNRDGKIVMNDETSVRFGKAKRIETTISTFLEKGFNGLGKGSEDQELIMSAIGSVILRIPNLRVIYVNLSDESKKAMVEYVALNPAYSRIIAEAARGIFDPTKIPEDTVSKLEVEVAGYERRLQEIERRLGKEGQPEGEIDTRLKTLEDELRSAREGGELDENGELEETSRLSKLQAALQSVSRELEPLESMQEDLDRELRELERAERSLSSGTETYELSTTSEIISNIEEVRERIKQKKQAKQENIRKYQELLAKKISLERIIERYEEGDYEKGLEKEIEALRKEKEALEKERREIESKLAKGKIDLETARREREFAEQQFLASLEGIWSEAAKQYFGQEIRDAKAKQKEILQKEAASADTDIARAIANGFLGTYYDSNGKPDSNRITEAYKKMMRIRPGTEGEPPDPDAGINEIAEQVLKAGGFTEQQIKALRGDHAKWLQIQSQVAENLIKHYTLNGKGGFFKKGGLMSRDEQIRILNSPWGQKAIVNGVEAARAQIEQVFKERLPTGSKLVEWLKNLNNWNWFIIIAIILGIGIFSAIKLAH